MGAIANTNANNHNDCDGIRYSSHSLVSLVVSRRSPSMGMHWGLRFLSI